MAGPALAVGQRGGRRWIRFVIQKIHLLSRRDHNTAATKKSPPLSSDPPHSPHHLLSGRQRCKKFLNSKQRKLAFGVQSMYSDFYCDFHILLCYILSSWKWLFIKCVSQNEYIKQEFLLDYSSLWFSFTLQCNHEQTIPTFASVRFQFCNVSVLPSLCSCTLDQMSE